MRERIFGDVPGGASRPSCTRPSAPRWNRSRGAAGGPYQVLVIPLLAEGGRRDHVDRVLVVDAPEALQIERLMRATRVTREQALAALAAQANREARLAIADDVIVNTGDLAALDGARGAHAREISASAAKRCRRAR